VIRLTLTLVMLTVNMYIVLQFFAFDGEQPKDTS